MIISKKLQVLTEDEILKEVAEELGIKRSDVQRTYDIWLKFLNEVANNTDQCTVKFNHIGKMFVSMHRMRRMYSRREKRLKMLKEKEIDKLDSECEYNIHKLSKPIILKYGISKKNYIPYILNSENKPKYYTLSEIINKQTNAFFKEDFEFRDNDKLREYFTRDNDDDIHEISDEYILKNKKNENT